MVKKEPYRIVIILNVNTQVVKIHYSSKNTLTIDYANTHVWYSQNIGTLHLLYLSSHKHVKIGHQLPNKTLKHT